MAQFATLLQMGLLGAILTLAPRLLYGAHALSTLSWNLTPLEDQQLGGVIMWVPGCAVMGGVLLLSLARVIRESGTESSGSPCHSSLRRTG